MCKKLPENDEEFLNISGVGQEKLKKYGKDFTETIKNFISENPLSVKITSQDEENFYCCLKNSFDSVKISEEPVTIQSFLEGVFVSLRLTGNVKPIRNSIYNILTENELITTVKDSNGKTSRDITPKSESRGIIMIERFGKTGTRYRNINITAKGQRFILKELVKLAENEEDENED